MGFSLQHGDRCRTSLAQVQRCEWAIQASMHVSRSRRRHGCQDFQRIGSQMVSFHRQRTVKTPNSFGRAVSATPPDRRFTGWRFRSKLTYQYPLSLYKGERKMDDSFVTRCRSCGVQLWVATVCSYCSLRSKVKE